MFDCFIWCALSHPNTEKNSITTTIKLPTGNALSIKRVKKIEPKRLGKLPNFTPFAHKK